MPAITDELRELIAEIRQNTATREETLQKLLIDSHRREEASQKREDRYYEFACKSTEAMTTVAKVLEGVVASVDKLRQEIGVTTAKSIDLIQLREFIWTLGKIGILALGMLLGADASGLVDVFK